VSRTHLIALNLAALVLAWIVVGFTSPSADPLACVEANACDASVFIEAARGLLGGELPYGRQLVGVDLPLSYPPWFLPLLLPLALGRPAALALALASNLGLVALSWKAREGLFALLVGLGGWTFFGVWLGQTGALVGCGGLLLLLGARHDRPALEALGTALVLIKPHLGLPLLLVLVLKGRWRGPLGGLVLVAALSLGATLAWGAGVWPAWLRALAQPPPSLDRSFMSSWLALWPGAPHALALLAWLMAPLSVLLLRARPIEPLLALAAAAALVWAPHSHPYDLAMLSLALLTAPRLRPLLGFALLSHACLFTGVRVPIALAALAVYVWLLRTPEPR
jgi:hypothetical protein